MRLSTAEQRYCQNSNNNMSFSGTRYLPKKYFDRLTHMSSFDQRLAIGAGTLLCQPPIDYFNPMTDEKTRKFSVIKTVVKILVGTATGLLIRKGGMILAERQLKDSEKFISKIKDKKIASKMKEICADDHKKKQFISNYGTVLGLLGVFIGDFTFDMPVAKFGIQFASDIFGLSEYEKKEGKK